MARLCLVAQSCPSLCCPMDCSPPGSSECGDSPGKNWSGLPCSPSGHLPNPGMEPRSPALRTECLPSEPTGKPVNPGVGSLSLLQGIFLTQEINLGSPAPWADSLPFEPPGKPKDTGEGSLSLLQQIFPTQESNQGLLHCRWILYQLSYQGAHGKIGGGFLFFLLVPLPVSLFLNPFYFH